MCEGGRKGQYGSGRERENERVYVKQKICKKYVWDRQRVNM